MTALRALIEAIEAGEMPDREAEAAIAVATGRFFKEEHPYRGTLYGYVNKEGDRIVPGNGAGDCLVPRYLTSLDAAATLMPEGSTIRIEPMATGDVRATVWRNYLVNGTAHHTIIAHAWSLAALKAREASRG